MRNVSLAAILVTTLLAATAASQPIAGLEPSLTLDARLDGSTATAVMDSIRTFCREHGWRVTTEASRKNGTVATVATFRTLHDRRWRTITVTPTGRVRATFQTGRSGALAHARLSRLLDRLIRHLADVRVTDSTRYYDDRDADALRARFAAMRALEAEMIADAYRRGEDITIGGRLHSEIPEAARHAFDSANALLRRGKFERAERALGLAIGLAPTYARALLLRAEIRAETGRAAKARDDIEAAVKAKPEMSAGHFARAKLAVADSRYDAALDHLDTALECEPSDVDARLLRGLVHVEGKRIRLALLDLEHAARPLLTAATLDPRSEFPGGMPRASAVTTLGALAQCYRVLDRSEEAERASALLNRLRPTRSEDTTVVLHEKSGLVFERPDGWFLESKKGDRRIVARLRHRTSRNACRIARMKQWGKLDDADFKATFNRSVLEGLTQLGNRPELLRANQRRTAGFDIYRILVKNRDQQYCWVACFHHGGQMITVYLTSNEPPERSGLALHAILEGLRVKRDTID